MGRDSMSKDYRTISQILEDDLKTLNEVRYTNIYNRIKGGKGLKRKDLDMLRTIMMQYLNSIYRYLRLLWLVYGRRPVSFRVAFLSNLVILLILSTLLPLPS